MDCFVLEKKVLENVNLFCLAPPFLASSLFIFLFCFVCFFVFLFVLFASQERKISRGNLHFFRHILLLCFYFIFERFDFVTKKNRFRDKPIFSLTHKIRFRDKPIFSLTKKNSISWQIQKFSDKKMSMKSNHSSTWQTQKCPVTWGIHALRR